MTAESRPDTHGELLPCPFCGGKVYSATSPGLGTLIKCKCGLSTDHIEPALWNTRPLPSTATLNIGMASKEEIAAHEQVVKESRAALLSATLTPSDDAKRFASAFIAACDDEGTYFGMEKTYWDAARLLGRVDGRAND